MRLSHAGVSMNSDGERAQPAKRRTWPASLATRRFIGGRPGRRAARATEHRDELASLQLIELHSVPCQARQTWMRLSRWNAFRNRFGGECA
jgi:hypothetical protein